MNVLYGFKGGTSWHRYHHQLAAMEMLQDAAQMLLFPGLLGDLLFPALVNQHTIPTMTSNRLVSILCRLMVLWCVSAAHTSSKQVREDRCRSTSSYGDQSTSGKPSLKAAGISDRVSIHHAGGEPRRGLVSWTGAGTI